jgi:L-histidine N-alpha-methyltransferase
MRPFAAPVSDAGRSELEQFASDVEYYLALTPRQLPSRYFYDALGSALFEAICQLPWYGITRAERDLLARRGQEILAHAELVSTLVELGPGSGEKLATLIGAGLGPGRRLTVHLVDVSPAALDLASRTLAALDAPESIDVVPHQAAYEAGLEAVARERGMGRMLTLFLGSNIGNFDPPGADAFLRNVRAALVAGDTLLVGTDLVKPEPELMMAYDDPLGVTAAFNRNLLVRINRELGADFEIAEFHHRAVWNAAGSRIEMHLVAGSRQHVRIPAASLDVVFAAGDTIWTESSYKYRPGEVVRILERAGFRQLQQWIDENGGFALTLAVAA